MVSKPHLERLTRPTRKPKLWCVLLTHRYKLGAAVLALSESGTLTASPYSVRVFQSKREASYASTIALGAYREYRITVQPWTAPPARR